MSYRNAFIGFVGVVLTACLSACYEPQKGCLDLNATQFDADADDPCDDCCTYPKLTVALEHRVVLPTDPDTFFVFQYNTPLPSPADTTHKFSVERSRYFLFGVKLVRENGEEVTVADSLTVKDTAGVAFKLENSFCKCDRDVFQTNTLGTMVTEGAFSRIKFSLGLPEKALLTDPLSVPTTSALSTKGDTLSYRTDVGYIPNLLIFKRDTFPTTLPTEFRLTEIIAIDLPLSQPFEAKRGFNLELTLRVNYSALFEGIDLVNDADAVIRQKLVVNLSNAFSVAAISNEK